MFPSSVFGRAPLAQPSFSCCHFSLGFRRAEWINVPGKDSFNCMGSRLLSMRLHSNGLADVHATSVARHADINVDLPAGMVIQTSYNVTKHKRRSVVIDSRPFDIAGTPRYCRSNQPTLRWRGSGSTPLRAQKVISVQLI